MTTANYQKGITERCLAALAVLVEATSAEVSHYLQDNTGGVSSALCALTHYTHAHGKRVYVTSWKRNTIGRYYWRPVYALGDKPCVPQPPPTYAVSDEKPKQERIGATYISMPQGWPPRDTLLWHHTPESLPLFTGVPK